MSSAGLEIDENSPPGSYVGAALQVVDPDEGDTLNYRFTGGSGVHHFNISQAARIAVTNNGTLDYEINPVLVLHVRATDRGGLFASTTLIVTINDVNESPVFEGNIYNWTIGEHSQVASKIGTPVNGIDPDEGQTLQYSILIVEPSTVSLSAFEIDSCSGQIRLAESILNYEDRTLYTLTVQVIDDGATPLGLYTTTTVYIEISNENDAPVLDRNYVIDIDEDTPAGNIGKAIAVTDEDTNDAASFIIVLQPIINNQEIFSFNALIPGQVVLDYSNVLDFESDIKNTFKLLIKAMDSGTPVLSTEADLTIRAIDVNETPVWTDATSNVLETINENSASGLAIGQPLDTMVTDVDVGSTLIFTLVSALACDNLLTTVDCNIAGDEGVVVSSWFNMDETSGQLILTEAAVVDFETMPKFKLTVKATDNGIGNLHSIKSFFVLVTDMPEPPQFAPLTTPKPMIDVLSADYLTFSIDEHVPIGTVVVSSSVLAHFVYDYDFGDTFVFSQVFGSDGDSNSVYDLSESIIWSDDTVLSAVPYWLTNEGTIHGWFDSNVAQVNTTVLVPGGATNVRVSVRYHSIGMWEPSDTGQIFVDDTSYWTKRRSSAITCNGWNEFQELGSSAGCFQDVEFNVPISTESPWQCVSGVNVPVRINEYGDVECFSTNNKHCMWGSCDAALRVEAATYGSTSLSCGSEHQLKWGKTGYAKKSHWCSKAREQLKQGAALQVSVHSTINAQSTSTAKWGFSRFAIVSGGKNIGTKQPVFKITRSGNIVTTKEISFNDAPTHSLSIQTIDSAGLTAQAVVTVVINDINQPPQFSSSLYVFYIPENSIGGIAAESDSDIIQAFDDDLNQVLVYSVDASETPTAASMFEVSSRTIDGDSVAVIVAKNNVDLDHEAQNNFTLGLVVTDAAGSTSNAVAIIYVTDVNEPPLPTTEELSFWVRGGTNQATVGTAITPNDPDADDEHDLTIISWKKCTSGCSASNPSYTGMALDAIPFAVDESRFTLFVPSIVNAVTAIANTDRFELVVICTDSGGYLKTVTINVQVTFNNNAPVAVDQIITVPENTNSYTAIGTISVADQDSLQTLACNITGASPSIAQKIFVVEDRYMNNTQVASVDGTVHSTNIMVGDLGALNTTIDFEEIQSYELNVFFFDDYHQPLFASAAIIVVVQDVNESPTIDSIITRTIEENSATAPVGGAVTANDPEQRPMVYEILNTEAIPFTIDSNSGQLTTTSLTAAPYLDFERSSYFDVSVQITDSVGLQVSCLVRVVLVDINEAPVLSTSSLSNLPSSISESTREGTILGTVSAMDLDADTTLLLSITSSPIDGIFSISGSGKVIVENAANLDYEALATSASTFSFPMSTNTELAGSFNVGTNGCLGYLDCQFSTIEAATNFCMKVAECQGIVHDTTNTRVNCERGMGCFYPKSEAELTAYVGRNSYLKTHVSDPLAKLTVTITASDSVLQDSHTVDILIEDANDIFVSAVSDLAPEFYDAETDGDEARFDTAGNEYVYLYGFNFGPMISTAETRVNAYYGVNSEYEAVGCIVFESNTVIRCQTVPGAGKSLPWSVAVGSFTTNQIDATLSYSAPIITDAPNVKAVYNLGTRGHCLESNNRVSSSETFFVGSGNACRQLCTLCAARETCKACLSYDWNRKTTECRLYQNVMMSADETPGSRCYYTLTTASALAFRTLGGDPFFLTGTNFGPVGTNVHVFYGPATNSLKYSALECTVAVMHTTIACVSAPGVGSNLAVTVSVVGQTARTTSGLLTYAPPSIEEIIEAPNDGTLESMDEANLLPPQNLPTYGGTLIDISGVNFPPLDAGIDVSSILTVKYGPTGFDFNAVNCRVIQSGMVIRCATSPGYGRNHYWKVEVDGLDSALSPVTTSYQKPSINECYGPACLRGSTAGGQLVVLFGANLFGPIEFVRYGHTGTEYTAIQCQQMRNHFVVACLTSPGVGSNHKWLVRQGSQTSELTSELTGYAAPALNTITGDGSTDASTLGGQAVTLQGTNFPPYGSSLAASNTVVTYSNGIQTFAASNCLLKYENRFSSLAFIECFTVASTGGKLHWDVTVDGQPSTPPTTSTAPPMVQHIKDFAPATSTTEGGVEFSLIGSEFGPVGLSAPSIEVTYGPTAVEYTAVGCLVTKVESTGNSTITCASAEGSGKDMPIMVTVTGQQSDIYKSITNGVLFSYASPNIVAISESVVNTGSALEIQLFGQNFGEFGANTSVTFGGDRMSVRHVSHVEIRFVVPDWQIGRKKPIVVTVMEQVSNAMYVHFKPPTIFDIGQSEEFTSIYTGTTIYIEGTSFGASSGTGRVLIDGLPCVVNTWGHTRIECETLDLEGELQVVVGEQSSDKIDFSVQKFLLKPVIDDMSITSGNPLGGYLVTLTGKDFADETVSTVKIGDKPCMVDALYPGSVHQDTAITCLVPPGEGRVNVSVIVDWQISAPMFFEYSTPVIHSQEATDHRTLGGAVITLVGEHLGDASVVFWDGEVSVETKGTSIGANGSYVSYNASTTFCDTGCMDRKFQSPCTHPSCYSCQWYLKKYCNEDNGQVNNNQLCSDDCIASGFSLTSNACAGTDCLLLCLFLLFP